LPGYGDQFEALIANHPARSTYIGRSVSSEVVAECVEEASGAFFASLSVSPELVEEDSVLDVGESGAGIRRLEFH